MVFFQGGGGAARVRQYRDHRDHRSRKVSIFDRKFSFSFAHFFYLFDGNRVSVTETKLLSQNKPK